MKKTNLIWIIGIFFIISLTSANAYQRNYTNEKCVWHGDVADNDVLTSLDTSCVANLTRGWGENEAGPDYQTKGGNLSIGGAGGNTAYSELNFTSINSSCQEFRFSRWGPSSEMGGGGFNNPLVQFYSGETLAYDNRWQDQVGIYEDWKDTAGVIATVNDEYIPFNTSYTFLNSSFMIISLLNGTSYTRALDNSVGNITRFRVYPRANNNGFGVRNTLTNITYVNCSTLPPSLPNITIKAADYFDASSITSFNISININGDLSNYSTNNGTILVVNLTERNYNITFHSNQSGGYFDRTYFDVNVSAGSSLNGTLYQSILYVNATEIVNNPITIFGINTNASSALNLSNSTGWATLRLKAGTYNLTTNATGYFNASQTFSIIALQNKTLTSILGNVRLSINASYLATGIAILNFNAQILKNSTDYSSNKTTTGGLIQYDLVGGDYFLQFQSNNASNTTVALTLTNSTLSNYTFSVYALNSINFTFWDEFLGRNNNILNGTIISIELTSGVFAQNYTTLNSTLNLELLNPSNYRISYSVVNYKKRDYYFTLTNKSHNDIDLYLLSNGNSTDTSFSVLDENNKAVENATIKMLKYYATTNSYIIVAMSKTDSNGAARINLEQFNAFYYFVFQIADKTLLITVPARIISSSLTYNVFLAENILKIRILNQQVSHTLTYTNSTGIVRYVYNDPVNILANTCLVVTQLSFRGNINICNTCSSASSGTILCTVNASLNSYDAYTILETNTANSPYLLDRLSISTIANAGKFGFPGVFIASYMIMALALLAMPIAWLSVILSIVGLVFTTMSGLLTISYVALIGIIITAALIIWKVRT